MRASRTGRDAQIVGARVGIPPPRADDIFGAPSLHHSPSLYSFVASLAPPPPRRENDADLSRRFEEAVALSRRHLGSPYSKPDVVDLELLEMERMNERFASSGASSTSKYANILTLRGMRVLKSLGCYDDVVRAEWNERFCDFLTLTRRLGNRKEVVVKMLTLIDCIQTVCSNMSFAASRPSYGAVPLSTDFFDRPAAAGDTFMDLTRNHIMARTNHTAFGIASCSTYTSKEFAAKFPKDVMFKILSNFLGTLFGKKTQARVDLDYEAGGCARSQSRFSNNVSFLRNLTCERTRTFFTELHQLICVVTERATLSGDVCINHTDSLWGSVPDGRPCKYRFFVAVNPKTQYISMQCAIESIHAQ